MPSFVDAELLKILRARLLDDFPCHVHACLDVLDEADLWWRPNEQANAVANLVLHVAGSNRYYVGHAIAGEPDVRQRDAEFEARGGLSKAEVLGHWNETAALVERVLGAMTPYDLGKTTDRTGRASSFARILLHVSHHNASHVAQIIWITKMRRPGAIVELTRRAPLPRT